MMTVWDLCGKANKVYDTIRIEINIVVVNVDPKCRYTFIHEKGDSSYTKFGKLNIYGLFKH